MSIPNRGRATATHVAVPAKPTTPPPPPPAPQPVSATGGLCGCCEIDRTLCAGLVSKGLARCCSDCTHDLTEG